MRQIWMRCERRREGDLCFQRKHRRPLPKIQDDSLETRERRSEQSRSTIVALRLEWNGQKITYIIIGGRESCRRRGFFLGRKGLWWGEGGGTFVWVEVIGRGIREVTVEGGWDNEGDCEVGQNNYQFFIIQVILGE